MIKMTDKQAGSPDLACDLEDKPPFGNTLLNVVTYLLAIPVPVITPALIVGGALELPVETTAYSVSMAMVASGVGTYLQVNRLGSVDSGMLSVRPVNFPLVIVMVALGTDMKGGGLTEDAMISTLLGVSFVDALLVCFSTWLLPYLKRAITPTVSGVVMMLIGLSLVHVGITGFGGSFDAKADGTFGSAENLGLAPLVLLIVLALNCLRNLLLRVSGVAVGLIADYIVVLLLGKVGFSVLQNLPPITLPVPFEYGLTFDWHAFIIAGATFLLSVFEVADDLATATMISEQPVEGEEYTKCLHGGVLTNDLMSVIATALGSSPLTTFMQNNGAIQTTGVASCHVGRYIAATLVLLGLFPVIGRAFTVIPSPVPGGATILMFGLIAIAGVQILVSHDIRHREAVIVATPVGLGLGAASEPEVFKNLPVLLQSSIPAGDIMAILLNLVLPEDKIDKAVKVETDSLDY